MIRIRGPVGTLRVLMLPGEPETCWESGGAEGPDEAPGRLEAVGSICREARRDP